MNLLEISPTMAAESDSTSSSSSSSSFSKRPTMATCVPPWEVLVLVAPTLDPEALAAASCVSKSWHKVFSSDDLWRRFCLSRYPSARPLLHNLPARQVFGLLRAASRRQRSMLVAPCITLHDLIFLIDVFRRDEKGTAVLSFAKDGSELAERLPSAGIFRFDIPVVDPDRYEEVEAGEELKVVWMVTLKGWITAFKMMNTVGKGKPLGDELWLSEELPSSACCGGAATCSNRGGLQSEVWIELSRSVNNCDGADGRAGGKGRKRSVLRVSLGMMSIAAWRYVTISDGLLYLQRYLLPRQTWI